MVAAGEHTGPSSVSRSGRGAPGYAYTRWRSKELHISRRNYELLYDRFRSVEPYLTGRLRKEQDGDRSGKEIKADARGLGSVRSDERESMTLKSDSAGDQFCLRMSIHMFPLSEIFMWYILTQALASIL